MFKGTKVYDITRPLAPGIAVWPGDRAYEAGWTVRLGGDSPVNVGHVALSTHAGTHADAPLHFDDGGAPIDEMPLLHYLGPCWVVRVPEGERRIDAAAVEPVDVASAPRVLFRTSASDHPHDAWRDDFAAMTVGLIEALAARGAVLVGTDAPSVDPAESKTLPVHAALLRHGIANLENLWLREVPPGRYTLAALPLRLRGMDAAPVRAVLVAS